MKVYELSLKQTERLECVIQRPIRLSNLKIFDVNRIPFMCLLASIRRIPPQVVL